MDTGKKEEVTSGVTFCRYHDDDSKHKPWREQVFVHTSAQPTCTEPHPAREAAPQAKTSAVAEFHTRQG